MTRVSDTLNFHLDIFRHLDFQPKFPSLLSIFQSTDVLRGSHDILKRSYPELREAVSEVGFNGGNANGDSMMFETCTNVSTAVGQQVGLEGDQNFAS